MLEVSHTNSPNTSMQPIISPAASHSTSMISDGSSRGSKRAKTRTEFYTVAKKVIDEMNHEEIEPEIEDESKAGYFSPDPEVEEEDEATIIRKSRDRIASSAYEIYFKPVVFVKFFIMHLLFFFIFGPFIFLLAPIFGKYVLINQGFMGISSNFFIQSVQYAAFVSFLVSYYLAPIEGLQAIEVYMICIAVLVRLITISSKYAYQSESFLKLLYTTRLTKKDAQGDLILFGWRLQQDVVIEEELQAALLRLEIDSSLFFFNFLGKTSLKLKESLSKHKMIGRLAAHEVKTFAENSNNRGDFGSGKLVTFSDGTPHHAIALGSSPREETVRHRVQSSERSEMTSEKNETPKSSVRERFKKATKKIEKEKKKEKITKTAQEIFKSFSHFLGTKKLEKSHLYGYNLSFDLLKHVRSLRYRYLGTTLMMISIVRAMIPTFYRLYLVYHKKEDIPIFTAKPFVVVILFIANTLFFWFNIFILSVPILDTYSKTYIFKQIGYLISPRKIAEFRDRKLYPTLNIFDPVTLKTWSNFRRLMNSYGRKYTLRSNFNVTITMIVYTVVLGILLLQVTGLVSTYSNPLLLVVLTYETVVFFTIFISIMLGGAFVNNQYKVHKNLLKKNKTIISDFQQLSYLYVGKEAIEPDNYIYKEGLKLLKAELGRGNNEEDFEEKLIARSEKLSTMIDDIIEELDFEEENEPFTVLGVPITYGILKSLAAAIASLGFAISQMIMP